MFVRRFFYCLFVVLCLLITACNPPPAENIYRKEGRYPHPSDLNVPVAFLVSEWAGKPRIMASGWLIEGGSGVLFSAKHFTDAFMNDIVELGANECKIFLRGKVYTCVIIQVPPIRDAVVIKILEPLNLAELPRPYKISTARPAVGDKVFVQGFHPHPLKITKSNLEDGLKDMVISVLKNFYDVRTADPLKQNEVVFDNLEGRVVKPDPDSVKKNPILDPDEKKTLLHYENDNYIKVLMARDHKFSFGGLSGGSLVNEKGEAVGIITAQDIFRFEYDKKGFFVDPFSGDTLIKIEKQNFDTLYVTPMGSVRDLYEYARTSK